MTIEQFRRLEAAVQTIDQGFKALESELINLIAGAGDKDKAFIAEALGKLSNRDITTLPYWWHLQPEWTGGDSVDLDAPCRPKNTKINPPHIYKALLDRSNAATKAS